MSKNKKITTIEDLAIEMQKGFFETHNVINKKIEGLAMIVQKGFEEMATKREINDLKSEIMTLRHDFEELKLKINKLEIIPTEFNFKIQDFEKRIKKIEAELQLR